MDEALWVTPPFLAKDELYRQQQEIADAGEAVCGRCDGLPTALHYGILTVPSLRAMDNPALAPLASSTERSPLSLHWIAVTCAKATRSSRRFVLRHELVEPFADGIVSSVVELIAGMPPVGSAGLTDVFEDQFSGG